MLIRPATPADAHGIAVVHVRGWQEAYRGLLPQPVLDDLSITDRTEGWRQILSARERGEEPEGARSHALVAVDPATDRILGWATYGEPREDGAHQGELWGLYAHPDFWSRGIGHALLGAVEDALRVDGARSAYLWVLKGNDRAATFYERHGWIEDGEVKVEERPDLRLHERRRVKSLS